jgi:hypothetical protein
VKNPSKFKIEIFVFNMKDCWEMGIADGMLGC